MTLPEFLVKEINRRVDGFTAQIPDDDYRAPHSAVIVTDSQHNEAVLHFEDGWFDELNFENIATANTVDLQTTDQLINWAQLLITLHQAILQYTLRRGDRHDD